MNDVKYCNIGYHANLIVGSSSAAYWDDARVNYHDSNIRDSFERIADILGYTITPIVADDRPDEVAA